MSGHEGGGQAEQRPQQDAQGSADGEQRGHFAALEPSGQGDHGEGEFQGEVPGEDAAVKAHGDEIGAQAGVASAQAEEGEDADGDADDQDAQERIG